MDEYIERTEALEITTRTCGDYAAAWSEIRKLPAADVAPVVHGRWKTSSDRPDTLICSVCKCGFDMWKHDPHNYCPNCGARMDGVENEV